MNESLVVLIRGIIAFFSLLIFTRILGKQQVSQLTLFEYVLGITIGSMAATLTVDLTSTAWSHFVGLFIWTFLVFIVQLLSVKFYKFAKYVNGQPQIIIANGKIMESTMRKMRYSLYDLLEQLRVNDIFDIREVEFAILEMNGKLTALKKSQYLALTPKDMNIMPEYKGLNKDLIFNGLIIDDNLTKVNLTRKWLKDELKKRGIKDHSEVFFASLNTSGELYLDLYKDRIYKDMQNI